MLRWRMRPLSAALALAHTLTFVAACMGACLSSEPARHGCCPAEQGLRGGQAVQDCCKVVPGISGTNVALAASSVQTPHVTQHVVSIMTSALAAPPLPAAVGPPLILRI